MILKLCWVSVCYCEIMTRIQANCLNTALIKNSTTTLQAHRHPQSSMGRVAMPAPTTS